MNSICARQVICAPETRIVNNSAMVRLSFRRFPPPDIATEGRDDPFKTDAAD
jgi:hypothetical protein